MSESMSFRLILHDGVPVLNDQPPDTEVFPTPWCGGKIALHEQTWQQVEPKEAAVKLDGIEPHRGYDVYCGGGELRLVEQPWADPTINVAGDQPA